ncbi:LysR family transcriptional regulator [Rhizobium sp. C4]|uniref:LysR family transcriptional regulator n=1 Tax=Rhizobium sp. C4 TaxID=1349800 RepID=UPI001E556D5C|nr:LysR family transcriptional regulator [Rhizobium sp. C4]MCD2173425.1 LysR family transcriptional regulator [Rhizobium sp. C4]
MRFDNLDMNLIVALEAILRLRSVSAAAEELNLTQPALSRALGRLRQHFDDQIVVPLGRQMVPTEFGETLHGLARQLLEEMRVFVDMRAHFDPSTARREVSIIASDYVIRVFLAKAAQRLASVAPGVSLRFIGIDGPAEAMFEQTSVDFRIVPAMALMADHPSGKLFTDEFVCIAWEDNPHVRDGLDAETYLGLKHVTTAFGARGRDSHFERFLKDQKVNIEIAMSMPNFVLLPECVVGTPYLTTIHARMAAMLEASLPVRILPVPIAVPPVVEYLQWHNLRRHDSASQWIRQFLLQMAAEL